MLALSSCLMKSIPQEPHPMFSDVGPFHDSVLQFFVLSPVSYCMLCFLFDSSHLTETQLGRDCDTRDRFYVLIIFWCIPVFNFLLASWLEWHWFLLDLEKLWRDGWFLGAAVRPEPLCPRHRAWRFCGAMGHAPSVSHSDSQWAMPQLASPRERARHSVTRTFCLSYSAIAFCCTLT